MVCAYVVMSHLNEPRKPKKISMYSRINNTLTHTQTKSTKTKPTAAKKEEVNACAQRTHWNNRRLCYGLWKSVCEFVDGIDVPSVQMQFGIRTVGPLVYLLSLLVIKQNRIMFNGENCFCSAHWIFFFRNELFDFIYSIFPIRNDLRISLGKFSDAVKQKRKEKQFKSLQTVCVFSADWKLKKRQKSQVKSRKTTANERKTFGKINKFIDGDGDSNLNSGAVLLNKCITIRSARPFIIRTYSVVID